METSKVRYFPMSPSSTLPTDQSGIRSRMMPRMVSSGAAGFQKLYVPFSREIFLKVNSYSREYASTVLTSREALSVMPGLTRMNRPMPRASTIRIPTIFS